MMLNWVTFWNTFSLAVCRFSISWAVRSKQCCLATEFLIQKGTFGRGGAQKSLDWLRCLRRNNVKMRDSKRNLCIFSPLASFHGLLTPHVIRISARERRPILSADFFSNTRISPRYFEISASFGLSFAVLIIPTLFSQPNAIFPAYWS